MKIILWFLVIVFFIILDNASMRQMEEDMNAEVPNDDEKLPA